MRKDQQHNPETESTIFSEHKSSVEIAEEKKAAKAAEKARRKEEKASRKKGEKDPGTRITVIALIVLGLVIIGGIVLIIVNQTRGYNREEAPSSAHFYSADEPEMSTEGIKGVVNEAYYTNDGSLCLKLTFSNGLEADHYLTSLEVILQNEDDEVIATGYTDAIPDNYCVPPQDTNTFTFYIESKYVKIADDDLDELSYEISTTGEIDAEAVPDTTASTTGTTAAEE